MLAEIQFADFAKLDIRIGRVTKVSEPDWSRKLIELTVDFGSPIGTRIILSGLRGLVDITTMAGKKYPFLINLAEKKMGQGVSQGMMLVVDESNESTKVEKVTLIKIDETVAEGAAIR